MRLILVSLTILLLVAAGFIILAVRGHAQQASPRTVATYAAGVIQINSTTTGHHAFTTAIPSTAGCAAGPLSDITRMSSIGWQVATSTTGVTITLSRAGTGRFWFLCFVAVN
jgi:hypothetical protein